MERLTERRIILIKRKTRLEDLLTRYNTMEQTKFFVEHHGGDFSDYLLEHRTYETAIIQVREVLERVGRVQLLDREFLPNYIFGVDDVIVVVGQDGLVANCLKYLWGQSVIGVNPDPVRWDGILLPFLPTDLSRLMPEVLANRRNRKVVTMASATLSDGQVLYGVNDLFIGQRTHVSARYTLKHGSIVERQSSSGIIVSTGLGSTGWLKSILAGADGIANGCSRIFSNNKAMQESDHSKYGTPNIDWDSEALIFSVREPYPSKFTQATLVFGCIDHSNQLVIQSFMPENGIIFSDGVESDYLSFNAGITATISIADKKGQLVI